MCQNHRHNRNLFCQCYRTEYKEHIITGPLFLKCQMIFIHKFFQKQLIPCPADKHFKYISCHLSVIKWMVRRNFILPDHPVYRYKLFFFCMILIGFICYKICLIFFCQVICLFKHSWFKKIIRIQKGQIFSCRMTHTIISGSSRPCIFLFYDLYTTVFRRIFSQYIK